MGSAHDDAANRVAARDVIPALGGPSGTGAFETFYRSNFSAVLRFVRGATRGSEHSEDIVSEAFLVAWQRYLGGGDLTRPWLFIVAKNKVGDSLRRAHGRHETPVAEVTSPETVNPTPESELRIDIERALNQLPDSQRELLVMAFWSDLSTLEACEVLNVSPGTYRVRLTRAKQALTQHVNALRQLGGEVNG